MSIFGVIEIGAFSEYLEVPAAAALKVPSVSPDVLPIIVCGLSASLALEQVGEMKTNQTILVTAAAGGTGQFAVQLAKLAGNHVIGTCSSDEKAAYLKSIGCDRVINYTKEDVSSVLKEHYPKGIDLVFETVGGKMLQDAIQNLALRGRVIVFGSISQYHGQDDSLKFSVHDLSVSLIGKSASVCGFAMPNHRDHAPRHIAKLMQLVADKKLNAGVDPTVFEGLEGIADGIDYMYARKNIGKPIVRLV